MSNPTRKLHLVTINNQSRFLYFVNGKPELSDTEMKRLFALPPAGCTFTIG